MGKKTVYTIYKIFMEGQMARSLWRTWGVQSKQSTADCGGISLILPMHKLIDIFSVTHIETATCQTEADMFLYEIYYINRFKPALNRDDKAGMN